MKFDMINTLLMLLFLVIVTVIGSGYTKAVELKDTSHKKTNSSSYHPIHLDNLSTQNDSSPFILSTDMPTGHENEVKLRNFKGAISTDSNKKNSNSTQNTNTQTYDSLEDSTDDSDYDSDTVNNPIMRTNSGKNDLNATDNNDASDGMVNMQNIGSSYIKTSNSRLLYDFGAMMGNSLQQMAYSMFDFLPSAFRNAKRIISNALLRPSANSIPETDSEYEQSESGEVANDDLYGEIFNETKTYINQTEKAENIGSNHKLNLSMFVIFSFMLYYSVQ